MDGERVYRLNPLGIGDAVNVFIDRATSAGFDPINRDDDLATATEICERVDRIPLAIEITAASSDVFGFKAILARLQSQTLPSAGARTSVARHQSLDALVEWSCDRLQPVEATVFRGLGPFVGGCRLDDAQVILGFSDVSGEDVARALLRLHDQSLIESNRTEPLRFSTLQTIRDFATKQLGDGDERTGLMRRFAAHYFDLATTLDADLRSFNQVPAIERLAAEIPNIRVALRVLATDPAVVSCGLDGLGALAQFWIRSGAIAEASAIFAAVDFDTLPETPAKAAALVGAALVAINAQDPMRGLTYARAGRHVARTLDLPWLEIHAAIAEYSLSELAPFAIVPEPFEHVYARAAALGEPWLLCCAALRRGSLRALTETAGAVADFKDALRLASECGDAFMTGIIQLNLARALATHEPGEAATHVIAAWRDMPPAHSLGRARCIERLAQIALSLARPDDAAFLLGVTMRKLADVGPGLLVHPQMRPLAAMLHATNAHLVESAAATAPDLAEERVEHFIGSLR